MWRGDQVWLHYVKNIIAADVSSAVFLASYLKYTETTRSFVSSMEVLDLQKYKVIRQENKIRMALRHGLDEPFVFLVGKN